MSNTNKDEMKTAIKEAIKEYVDESIKGFGWFSLKTLIVIGSLVLIAVAYKLGVIG